MTRPTILAYRTPDEAAECLPVSDDTYRALWALMPAREAEKAGLDEDTRFLRSLEPADGITTAEWDSLTSDQQADLASALTSELGRAS